MPSGEEIFLLAFRNINIRLRKNLNYKTQYAFAQDSPWHQKQWSRYEKPCNMELITMRNIALNLKVSEPEYMRMVADEMERLQPEGMKQQ